MISHACSFFRKSPRSLSILWTFGITWCLLAASLAVRQDNSLHQTSSLCRQLMSQFQKPARRPFEGLKQSVRQIGSATSSSFSTNDASSAGATAAIEDKDKKSNIFDHKLRNGQEHINSPDHYATFSPAVSNNNNNGMVILIGLVRDMREIRKSTWSLLAELSCQYGVSIHITANLLQQEQPKEVAGNFCGPIFIESQDDVVLERKTKVSHINNRLERLAVIRDMQRQRIQQVFFSSGDDAAALQKQQDSSKVILMDLDLWGVPSAAQIMARVHNMYDMHVVCGAGNFVDSPKRNALFYYDNFALVYWPDTFALAKAQRLIPHFYQSEDEEIVHRPPKKQIFLVTAQGKKKHRRGNMKPQMKRVVRMRAGFSQYAMFSYLQEKAKVDVRLLVPVRSCFGGLAIYKASTWLHPACQYQMEASTPSTPHDDTIMRYASKKEGLPCEHVVFHDCLHRKVFTPRVEPHMGLDPFLITHWRKNTDLLPFPAAVLKGHSVHYDN